MTSAQNLQPLDVLLPNADEEVCPYMEDFSNIQRSSVPIRTKYLVDEVLQDASLRCRDNLTVDACQGSEANIVIFLMTRLSDLVRWEEARASWRTVND
ncbi:hypothetical protein DTO271G3_3371 [Paecilomyces variotii]|nr:hypothetical protein DTO271G3_3371 [Paecilomyces variotii]